jgi:hypothetical protein
MRINNKTILISGIILLGIVGAFFGYEQTLIASISGLVGYLAKDINIKPENSDIDEEQ